MDDVRTLIQVHPQDTVAVVRRAVAAGERLDLDGISLTVLEPIDQGHKIALVDHHNGDPVIRYGHQIGLATEEIRPGSHVHVHNLRTVRGLRGGAA